MLAIGALIFAIRMNRRPASALRDDPEAARNALKAAYDRRPLDLLDAVSPVVKFKRLRAAGDGSTSCYPDQTGSYLSCVICLETFHDLVHVRRLLCGHIFHAACIDKWFRKDHRNCPLCMVCYVPEPPTEPPPAVVSRQHGHT
jgi:hypothetical protein